MNRHLVVGLALGFLSISSAALAGPLFSSDEVLNLELAYSFSDFRAKAAHIQSDADKKNAANQTSARLKYFDPLLNRAVEIAATVRIRGLSSKFEGECTFPKIKLKLASAEIAGTLFAGAGSLGIGTHCGELPEGQSTKKYHRVANETSPVREYAGYQVWEALGIPTLETRLARITYVNTDDGQRLTRNALLLEDDDAQAARLGGVAASPSLFTPDAFRDGRADLTEAVRAHLGSALLGNWDFTLWLRPNDWPADSLPAASASKTALRNVKLVRVGKRWIVAPYDLDLSSAVTGGARRLLYANRISAKDAFAQGKASDELQLYYILLRLRTRIDADSFASLVAQVLAREPAVRAAVDRVPMDAIGRARYVKYIDLFYRVLPRAAAMPVTASASVPCAGVPAATPVQVLSSEGGQVTVAIPDLELRWPGCAAQPVQTSRSALRGF